jgi:predicted RND superfamily exporter protein
MLHPFVTLLAFAMILSASIFGVSRLHVDPNPESYIVGTDAWAAYTKIDRDYDISETVVIAFRELGGTVFDVETVSAVAQLDHQLADMPEVQRVLSIASATALDRDNDVLDLTPLLPAGPVTRDTAIKLATRIRRHPVYGQALVDKEHETTFLFVQLSSEEKDPLRRVRAVQAIREKGEAFREKHRTVHFAGSLFTKEAIAGAVQRDALIFLPIAVVIIGLLLWLVFGELTASLVTLVVLASSAVIAMSILGAFGMRLNLTTASMPVIVAFLGLGECVQLLAELRRCHARTGDREASLIAAVEGIALPALITTAAGLVAFFALGRSKIEPIRQLGYAAAVGAFAVYALSILVVPTVLRLLRYPRPGTRAFASAAWLGQRLGRFAVKVEGRIIVTIASIGLFTGVCVAALLQIRVDSSYVGYLDSEHRLRQDMAVIDRTLGGTETIELILDADRPAYFKEIAQLRMLDRLGQSLQATEGIHTAFSLADYLKIANAVMVGKTQGDLKLPDSTEAVAQLTVIDPTPFSAFTSGDMQQARVALQIRSMSSEALLGLANTIIDKADQILAGANVRVSLTGLPMLVAKSVRYVVDDAARTFLLSALLIWVVMILGLRSIAIGTVALVPNLLAVVFTLGTMSFLGLALDQNLVFVLSLGIAIASHHAVHIASRYQRAREEGSPTRAAAAQYALSNGGHPMLLMSAVVAAAFSVLCVSSFVPTAQMGLLGGILIVYALVLDLSLLPALLMTADALENRYAASVPSQRPSKVEKQLKRASIL